MQTSELVGRRTDFGGPSKRSLVRVLGWHPLAVILILALSLALPSAGQAADVGKFTQVQGQVDLLKNAKPTPVPAKPQDGVAEKDAVHTKALARAQLQFMDDSVLTIAPESQITIESYMYDAKKSQRKAEVKIGRGFAHAVVKQVSKVKEPDFLIKGPTAIMGIRGTEWFVLCGPNFTDVYVKSGIINACCNIANVKGEENVGSMKCVRIQEGKPPTEQMELTEEELCTLYAMLVTGVPVGFEKSPGPKQMLKDVKALCMPAMTYTPPAEDVPPDPVPQGPPGGKTASPHT